MKLGEALTGIREFLAWAEQHPDLEIYSMEAHFHGSDREQIAEFARSVGKTIKSDIGEYLKISRRFGFVEAWSAISHNEVCVKTVVGTRTIPAEPEHVVPAQPERTEEVVSWDCQPILAGVTDGGL